MHSGNVKTPFGLPLPFQVKTLKNQNKQQAEAELPPPGEAREREPPSPHGPRTQVSSPGSLARVTLARVTLGGTGPNTFLTVDAPTAEAPQIRLRGRLAASSGGRPESGPWRFPGSSACPAATDSAGRPGGGTGSVSARRGAGRRGTAPSTSGRGTEPLLRQLPDDFPEGP